LTGFGLFLGDILCVGRDLPFFTGEVPFRRCSWSQKLLEEFLIRPGRCVGGLVWKVARVWTSFGGYILRGA
jgi:hypothetical protein